MNKFKVGDRVKIFGFYGIPEVEYCGVVSEIRNKFIIKVNIDGQIGQVYCHYKQCRKLIKKVKYCCCENPSILFTLIQGCGGGGRDVDKITINERSKTISKYICSKCSKEYNIIINDIKNKIPMFGAGGINYPNIEYLESTSKKERELKIGDFVYHESYGICIVKHVNEDFINIKSFNVNTEVYRIYGFKNILKKLNIKFLD